MIGLHQVRLLHLILSLWNPPCLSLHLLLLHKCKRHGQVHQYLYISTTARYASGPCNTRRYFRAGMSSAACAYLKVSKSLQGTPRWPRME